MNSMKTYLCRTFILSFVFLCILLAISSGQAQKPFSRPPRFPNQFEVKAPIIPAIPAVQKIRVIEGKVFADITASPLQTVLQELADRTGILFEVQSQHNPPVSVHLTGIPVAEAIERIVTDSNIIYIYNESDSTQVSLARILPRANTTLQPSILSLGTGVVTKFNIEINTSEQAQKVLSSTADLDDRKKAIGFLVMEKGKSSTPALMEVLDDSAPEIRIATIDGLAALKSYKALPGILDALKDSDPEVRKSAVSAVALLGTSRNIKDLKPLTFDKNFQVSAAAETAIQKLSPAIKH
jgi:hypothetical protein